MSLKEHTVKSYDDDLKSIAKNLQEMLELVVESINMVGQMIKYRDETIIEKIKPHDYKINSLDILIEKKVTALLALRQPMAVDLRYIISSIKVASNLERSGDQSKSIIKKIARLGDEKFSPEVEQSFESMIELCKKMVVDSVSSFNDHNLDLARTIGEIDDKIDDMYSNFFKIKGQESFSAAEVKTLTNILFIAKSFERLADHTTNIAEIAEFVITGEVVQ